MSTIRGNSVRKNLRVVPIGHNHWARRKRYGLPVAGTARAKADGPGMTDSSSREQPENSRRMAIYLMDIQSLLE